MTINIKALSVLFPAFILFGAILAYLSKLKFFIVFGRILFFIGIAGGLFWLYLRLTDSSRKSGY